ncbi:MAG: ASKHA domain-containing protein [Candidatus Hodarchaeota archaeon]
MGLVTIIFEPEGKKIQVERGTNLLKVAKEAGAGLRSECGGIGSCGKCKILTDPEKVSPITETEKKHLSLQEMDEGYRMACMTSVKSNAVIRIPAESRITIRRIQISGMERPVNLNPSVEKIRIILKKPSLNDTKADDDRLLGNLEQVLDLPDLELDHQLMDRLPHILRDGNWEVTATIWNNERVINLESEDTSKKLFGFAIDIGTSKIAGYLVDLSRGKEIAASSVENPQIFHGEDIISRISFATKGLKQIQELQSIVIKAINRMIIDTCRETDVSVKDICEMTIVGNTVMSSLLLRIPTKYLAIAPYPAAVKRPVNIKASKLGLEINSMGNIHVLPNVAGYVGADALADVLATGIYDEDDMTLLIDIGTNGEIFVGNQEGLMCCSCAAGPAFEGLHIKYGMKAVTGAIERVRIDQRTHDVNYETIDKVKPVGICGSGMVDAVAEMFKSGVITNEGLFKNQDMSRSTTLNGRIPAFIIAWKDETNIGNDILVSAHDIEKVLLGKAAIHAGTEILIKKKGLVDEDIERVFIAGAFGNYLNPESAKFLGLIPDIPIDKISFVGNTALSGAKMALLSKEVRSVARRLSKSIEYVELTAEPDFKQEFVDSLFIPHRKLSRYPSVKSFLEKD